MNKKTECIVFFLIAILQQKKRSKIQTSNINLLFICCNLLFIFMMIKFKYVSSFTLPKNQIKSKPCNNKCYCSIIPHFFINSRQLILAHFICSLSNYKAHRLIKFKYKKRVHLLCRYDCLIFFNIINEYTMCVCLCVKLVILMRIFAQLCVVK